MKRLAFALILVASLRTSAQTIQSLAANASADVRTFYASTAFAPVWTRDGRPTPQAQAAMGILENAASRGLDPADYAVDRDASPAAFDVQLTAAVMQYATDVRIGRVNPREVEFALDADAHRLDLPLFTAQLANAADVCGMFDSIEPQHADYRRLLAALAKYRRIEAESRNDAPLPVVPKVAPGSDYEGLAQLATLLRRNGDLAADVKIEGTKYEGAIVDAVKHFQSRHGLDADGVIAKATFAQLGTPVAQRIRQIEWSLERWRWIPAQLDGPAILVNIPEFRLRARDGNEELTMRVVVGRAAGHRTPVFDGDIKHVVFRPSWSVPPNIQRNEILPKIQNDRGYLARNHYELVDGEGRGAGTSVDEEVIRRVKNGSLRVRQTPGDHNALGLVKFLFPNDNHIYLHSTPQQALFSRTRRDFSHGCIRVEDPAELAEWALRAQPEWTREKIDAAMNGKKDDVWVKVERPIAVMILYATVVAEADGEVRFLDDIYGHDVQLAKVLTPATKSAPVVVAAK